MNIRAVLFDLDNTLTHREQSITVFSQRLANAYQSFLNQIDILEIKQIIEYIDHGGYPLLERLTHKTIGASVAYALIEQLDWKSKPDPDELTQFWFDEFGLSAVPMSGAFSVLETLKQQNYKLAVVSNGGHATRQTIIKGLGFEHFFDEIISSERIGISKPHPEIFLKSCALLGVSPQYSLFIGDHPVNDFMGAKDAGLKALLLEGFHEHDINDTTAKITRLSQIFEHL
ncbi:HAD family hydrolase [Acinetobacter stercoris]|uniref:Phosphoglycolate phosphatase n=1 Tax=Acinetobacter stercoris TaxID=2126983 RepID=A0A2U3MYG6_9GAMM|nr:HAD family hydrolase [Acinetobacter stercoris]SPL70441.1 Phosphoglycolate phosphatase [Acinetobacter stercoris]